VDETRDTPARASLDADERALLEHALEQHRRGALHEAELAYGRLLRARPDDSATLLGLAALYAQTGRPSQALDMMSRAAGREVDAAATRLELARALLRVDALTAALDQLDEPIACAARRCVGCAARSKRSRATSGPPRSNR
jgi:predicted Zn-dependent protease